MNIQYLIKLIRGLSNCIVHPPLGFPDVEKLHFLPNDLYELIKYVVSWNCSRIENLAFR